MTRDRLAAPLLLALSLALTFTATPALAQLELPRPSPFAKVSQNVGLTEITVDYSSPAVNNRKIWGGLVPEGELWRTGANAATKITFNKSVTVAGHAVPAGTYAIFTIPGKTEWTVILNKNTHQGGTREYKKDLDVVRVQIKPQPAPHRERMTFLFSNFNESTASLDLEWEKLRLTLPIKVATDEQAAANIKAMTESSWRPYTNAARYLMDSRKDYDGALALIEKSLAIREEWFNVWTKAQLLAAKGKHKEALTLGERAKAMGEKAEAVAAGTYFLAEEVKKALAEWKGK